MKMLWIVVLAIYFFCGCTLTPQEGMRKLTQSVQLEKYYVHKATSIDKMEVVVQKKEDQEIYDIWTAKGGDRFLIFNLFITNHHNTSVVVMPAHFNLVSTTGKIYGAFDTKGYQDTLGQTRIKAYETIRAHLLFEVPKGEEYEELIFAPFNGKSLSLPLQQKTGNKPVNLTNR